MHKCEHCNKIFNSIWQKNGHQRAHSLKPRSGKEIKALKKKSKEKHMRSLKEYMVNPIKCANCNAVLPYKKAIHRKSDKKTRGNKNIFCSSSCSATFNNTRKKFGIKRSKLELWLEQKLINKYPYLEIHFCRKDTINSELDIYIPSLRLAFELNGIFHYEPIYGQKILKKIMNNDNRKFQACIEKNIELCLINVTNLKYFKEQNAWPYLKIISDIINTKLPFGDSNHD